MKQLSNFTKNLDLCRNICQRHRWIRVTRSRLKFFFTFCRDLPTAIICSKICDKSYKSSFQMWIGVIETPQTLTHVRVYVYSINVAVNEVVLHSRQNSRGRKPRYRLTPTLKRRKTKYSPIVCMKTSYLKAKIS